jgi:hypothetical protein
VLIVEADGVRAAPRCSDQACDITAAPAQRKRTGVLLAAAGATVRHALKHLERISDAAARWLLRQLADKAHA